MAKSKPSIQTAAAPVIDATAPAPSMEIDLALAQKALRCLYGIGVPESVERCAAMNEATIKAMASAERENRRDKIPAILARMSSGK